MQLLRWSLINSESKTIGATLSLNYFGYEISKSTCTDICVLTVEGAPLTNATADDYTLRLIPLCTNSEETSFF